MSGLLDQLMRRVATSKNPRITAIYLPPDEYREVLREARVKPGEIDPYVCEERRVVLAGARCWRLSEIPRA